MVSDSCPRRRHNLDDAEMAHGSISTLWTETGPPLALFNAFRMQIEVSGRGPEPSTANLRGGSSSATDAKAFNSMRIRST